MLEHLRDGLLEGEVGRVDEHRAVGLLQRRDRAALVLRVALLHVGEGLLERDRLPLRDELGMAAPRADLGARGEEELHLGVGEHDRADVAALEHDAAAAPREPLQLEEDAAHVAMSRDRARALRDVRHADGLGDVLAAPSVVTSFTRTPSPGSRSKESALFATRPRASSPRRGAVAPGDALRACATSATARYIAPVSTRT